MPQEATLEVSFPKVLVLVSFLMAVFFAGLYAMGIRIQETQNFAIGFVCSTFVGAAFACLIYSCRIGYDGLRPVVPTFKDGLIRWSDITEISGIFGLSYMIRGGSLLEFIYLPGRFLLKHPDSLRQLLERYAPADNIVRKKLAA